MIHLLKSVKSFTLLKPWSYGGKGQYRGKMIANSYTQAYLAGFFDGDGSVMIQLRERKECKLLFRVKTLVILYQDTRYLSILKDIQSILGFGYVYERNDHMSELRIEGHLHVFHFLSAIRPYVKFKTQQVRYMLQALKLLQKKYSLQEFLEICDLADQVSASNYSSKRRKYTAEYVRTVLRDAQIIPVTTGVSPNR